jgi:hypothetical protein
MDITNFLITTQGLPSTNGLAIQRVVVRGWKRLRVVGLESLKNK